MKLLKYISILLIFSTIIFGQKFEHTFLSPKSTKSGIIATDNLHTKLYLIKNNEVKTLLTERGCGNYFSISSDEKEIGIKIIADFGMETPAIYNIQKDEISPLHKAANNAGQVSFSNNGLIVFTISNELHLSDGRKYDLGNYANLAPISPDGKFVAYNNDDDQIFLLNLETEEKIQITAPEFSYYNPQWSPNSQNLLLNRFDGKLCIFADGKLTPIEEGHSPSWQNNNTIIFYKKEIENMQLINTDLYSIKSNGSELTKLTDTKDKLEIDPTFDKDTKSIIYNNMDINSIESISTEIHLGKSTSSNAVLTQSQKLSLYFPATTNSKSESILDIPYIHQVYDVPDWYWGYYACAPTTSMMILAYFNILPEWETTCSSPSRHKSKYGRYICEKYRYNEWYYDDGSKPNGNSAGYGGYGYMWGTGGSPNSRMLNYHEKHGMTGSQSWNAHGKWSQAVDEIANGYPYSLCVWLTGGGHLVLGKGIVDGKHSVIVNDPYGNRNTPGYPSYDGKGAIYDWPGYNHGNINLAYAGSGLPWVVVSHFERPSTPDTLIDDSHFGQGFNLNTVEPASMIGYADKKSGYNGHFWYMLSQSTETTHYAEWNPNLGEDGNYELFAYIPEFAGKSQNAIYQIFNGEKWESYPLNQSFVNDEWASLGIYSLEAGNANIIRLVDSTNSDGEILVIDALKWTFVGQWSMEFEVENPSGNAPHAADFHELIEYTSDYCDYFWEFGDGAVSDEQNPVHVYKTPGTYDVKLTLFIGSKEYQIVKENYIEVSEYQSGDFTLIAPAIDTILISQSPTFSWESHGDSEYLFYVDNTSDFSETAAILVDTNQYVFLETLDDNTEYFWMVKSISESDTLQSNIGYFLINSINDPPAEFSLLFPQAEAILKNETCTFQWEKSSDNDVYDEVNYTMNLWKDDNTTLVYSGKKSFCTDTLEDNSTYYWNVIATDNNNGTTTNDKSRFHVNKFNDVPSVVNLLTPTNGGTSYGKNPQFSWSPAIDIDPLDSVTYEIYIFKVGKEGSGVTRSVDTTYYDEQKISSDAEYGFTVTAYDQYGAMSQSDTNFFYLSTTAIDDIVEIPATFQLHQNYPNPFNPSTSIRFDLPQTANIKLMIYDISGKLIETLVNEQLSTGFHTYSWQPENISSGFYFYKIEAVNGSFQQVQIQKCLFIK